jgi:DNA-binding response OmpR family regulator
MHADQPNENDEAPAADVAYLWRRTRRPKRTVVEDRPWSPRSYRMRMGRETIRLDTIEFRILRFLAANPYRAYSRRCIADAVSTTRHPVAEETLDRHISSLRQQLGFFRDYIQSVPYIGYRFKA